MKNDGRDLYILTATARKLSRDLGRVSMDPTATDADAKALRKALAAVEEEIAIHTAKADRDATILALAKRLGFETLETRQSDSLDFHDVAVWSLKEALEAAYEAGRTAGK